MKTSHAINFPTDTSSPYNFFAQSQIMNIISPQADPKPSVAASIALVPILPFQVQATTAESNNSSKMMCPEKNININAYALFLVLEKQRNLKLRELYRQRFDASSVDELSQSTQNQKHQEHYGVSLPTFPPRYQNLNLSTDWLMLKLRKQRPTSQAIDEYKALDNVTKTFLEDTVRVLQDQCVEDAIINNMCSTCNVRSMNRSSITITPPSSPLRLPRAILTQTEEEPPSISLSKSPSDPIHEVDLSDDQIMSLYEISESSGDALTLTEEEPPSISLSKSPSDSIHEVDLSDDQIMSLYEISESSGDAVVLNSRLI